MKTKVNTRKAGNQKSAAEVERLWSSPVPTRFIGRVPPSRDNVCPVGGSGKGKVGPVSMWG